MVRYILPMAPIRSRLKAGLCIAIPALLRRVAQQTDATGTHFAPPACALLVTITHMTTIERGVLALLVGVACFVANDAIVKIAAQAVSTSQLIFVRSVVTTALLLAACAVGRVRLQAAALKDRRILVRSGLDVASTLAFVMGLKRMELANAIAINAAGPLMVTLLAVLLYGEAVSARRWVAIAVGFCGVLLVVQPAGEAFNSWSLLMLLAAFFSACRDVATRWITSDVPAVVIAAIGSALLMLFSAAWGMGQEWELLTFRQLLMLASAGGFLACGYFFVTVALRAAEIAVIAPFRYASLLYSAVLGYLIWDDVPNLPAWCGMALIVTAGVYLARRQ